MLHVDPLPQIATTSGSQNTAQLLLELQAETVGIRATRLALEHHSQLKADVESVIDSSILSIQHGPDTEAHFADFSIDIVIQEGHMSPGVRTCPAVSYDTEECH